MNDQIQGRSKSYRNPSKYSNNFGKQQSNETKYLDTESLTPDDISMGTSSSSKVKEKADKRDDFEVLLVSDYDFETYRHITFSVINHQIWIKPSLDSSKET